MSMSELRDLVIDAHGGMERWSKVKTIDGDMSITGALWARKGWPDALKAVHVTADTRSQCISYRRFISEGMCSVCTPDRTVIETQDGKPIKDCAEQIFHVNGDGLICRMDYSAPVTGGAPIAHYLSEHKDFSGIKIAPNGGRFAGRRTAPRFRIRCLSQSISPTSVSHKRTSHFAARDRSNQ